MSTVSEDDEKEDDATTVIIVAMLSLAAIVVVYVVNAGSIEKRMECEARLSDTIHECNEQLSKCMRYQNTENPAEGYPWAWEIYDNRTDT